MKVDEARIELGRFGGVTARSWIWAGAAAAALVVLTAAVWNGLRENETETPREEATGVASGDLIGDPATAGPCALFDQEALGVHGETRIDTDRGGFNRCDLHIENDTGGVDLSLYFYESGDEPEPGETEMVGSIGVIRREGEHESCERTLVLPDGRSSCRARGCRSRRTRPTRSRPGTRRCSSAAPRGDATSWSCSWRASTGGCRHPRPNRPH
ncbi:hypothetical protein [Glycomyces sp. YM15]|uniref:hypothetical protein n=1 Tax=Glycomyces sp. YM15 TaxID=2800446 RepID=UPI0019654050|nr:hypothetical protein [Glycomyces sp. YM15]